MIRPPAGPERLLRALLPPGVEGDAMLGDLREETARHAARGGRAPRLFWAARAGSLAASLAVRRLASAGSALGREVAWAARGLRRQPSSSLTAVVVVALGVGLSTTMASVAWGLFVRDLDVPGADRLRIAAFHDPLLPDDDVAPSDLLAAWREEPAGFEAVAGFRTGPVNLAAGDGAAELRSAGRVTPDAFDVLGVRPVLGRGFTASDARAGEAGPVLLSHALWRARFTGADVIGSTVRIDGRPATVIGVMPPDFGFPIAQELWLPEEPGAAGGGSPGMVAFGLLRAGVDDDEAGRRLEAVVASLRPGRAADVGRSVRVEVVRFNEFRGGGVLRVLLGAMMAAALLVLLVASANLAGILLARTAFRMKEVGVRTALGAGAARTTLPFLAQAGILAAAGAAAGLALAAVGVALFEESASAAGKPYWMSVRLDAPAVAFAAGTTVLVALLAAAGPVVLASRSDPARLLGSGARGTATGAPGRGVRALVVLQIALSCGLLVGSGLVGKSLVRLTRMDFPFARADVLTADLRPPAGDYPDRDARARLWDLVLERLAAVPGTGRVALSHGLPSLAFERLTVQGDAADAGDPDRLPRAWRAAGSPGVTAVLAMEPVRGRGFLPGDDADAEPVAVVEAEMARLLFGEEEPVGRRFREMRSEGPGPWRRVVGVTGELRLEGVSDLDEGIGYYVPLAQADPPRVSLLVESDRVGPELAADVRTALAEVDPDLAVHDVKSLREVVGETGFFYRIFGGLFATFGVAGLFMACVGLYGILSWSVARRVPELGMRMALGADGASLVGLVLRDAAVHTALGLVLGLGLAALAGDALSVLLFQVEPRDPAVFAAVAALVAVVSLAAAGAPALRTLRVDPMAALRDG